MGKEKSSFGKKLQNFWYYYKVHTIIGLLVAALIGVTVSQCANRESPDYTVILYMQKELSEQMTDAVSAEMERYGKDCNGDGKVIVEIVNCSYDPNGSREVTLGSIGKMQAQLALPDAPLMITDQHTFADLDEQGVFAVRDDLPDQDGKALALKDTPLYQAVNGIKANYLVNELYLSIRDIRDNQYAQEFMADSQELLENILAAYLPA